MAMCNRFDRKVALIIGSTSGIGLATAQRLCEEGASVIICSRKQENVDEALNQLKTLVPKGKVIGTVCHVGNPQHRKNVIKFAVETFGRIDIVVLNAAVNPQVGGLLEIDESAIDKVIDVNLKAAIMLVREVVPHMTRKGANIIFMSTVTAYNQRPELGMYGVTKTALLGLTSTLSKELAELGIRVNCVAPGTVYTKFGSTMDEVKQIIQSQFHLVCIKRAGKPEEIAATIAFLASDDASYITGETIVIAGGIHSRL
eukprot:TRINITY_DN18826_c0_g1_i1.p1 TRINITY_DN18826_c0_g1~~TRINITY_DN18826_c0_g1_i1.p1  ORF type:complete len:257 (-),score=24.79 TRINITY_DN18826_c0_g1_i1:386-1156(-)